jgi:aminoglycoside 2''-phosphotransferase
MSRILKTPANNPAVLLKLINDNFPELSWKSYRFINEGWDHEVLILDNHLVFRFPNDQEYRALLKDEVKVLKKLRPMVQVNIPNYTYIANDFSFAGYKLIPGEPLSKKFFNKVTTANRTNIARQLAGFLSTIHNLISDGYDFSLVIPADVEEHHVRLKKQAKQYLSRALSPKDYLLTEKILKKTDELLDQPLPMVLNHGDIYNNHLLWNSRLSQLGIIDFSDMNRGDPAFDFAELYEYGKDFVLEVYGYYRGLRDDTFLERAWIYQEWMGVYMMVDHFLNHKTSWEKAKETFERVKN